MPETTLGSAKTNTPLREWFDSSMRLYRDRVFGFAVQFLGNRADAEDVTQDVFIRLWKNREVVDQSLVQPWLFRVARNACVDLYRRRRLQPTAVSEEDVSVATAASDGPGPDEWTDQRIFEQHLGLALRQLPDLQRSIVILREIQGLKYDEICETLELPMSTVKVYLHRGRRALRRQLSDVYHAEFA